MKILLTPKYDGFYGLKVGDVLIPVIEAELQFILNDKYIQGTGIKSHDDKYIVSFKSGARFGIENKSEFLEKLRQAYQEVSNSNENYSFEI